MNTGVAEMPMAIIALVRLGPRKAARAMARMRNGQASIASVMREIRASVQPPTYPASKPIGTPSDSEMHTETSPARSDARAPQMTRDATSRPISSVPNKWVAVGGLRTSLHDVWRGSCGAIVGASTAITTKNTTTPSPSMAPRRRLRRRRTRWRGVSSRSAGMSSASVATWLSNKPNELPSRSPDKSPSPLSSQTRVDDEVREVGEQVEEDVCGRSEQHHALHDAVVAIEDGVHDQLAEAGDAEHLLGQHSAGKQRPEFERTERDDRDQRISKRVLEDDHPLVEALGARGADVIGIKNLQHGAARVAHQNRCDGVSKHEGRHDHRREIRLEVLERTDIAGSRKPAQRHRKKQDEHDAEPEVRRRKPPQCEHVRGVIKERVLVDRRYDAGGNPDDQRDDDGEQRELERDGQLFKDELEHGFLDAHRFAEVSLEHAAGPVQIADGQRIIEVQLLVQMRDHARVPVLAREDDRRITGKQLLQAEDQDRNEEQRRNDGGETLNEVGAHETLVYVVSTSRKCETAPTTVGNDGF